MDPLCFDSIIVVPRYTAAHIVFLAPAFSKITLKLHTARLFKINDFVSKRIV